MSVKKLNGVLLKQQNHCSFSCDAVRCWKWDISPLIRPQKTKQLKYAVLILNRPLTLCPDFFKSFWNNAKVRITIDGGTKKWDTFLCKYSEKEQLSIHLPDLITGDFDSISEETLQKYKKKGCKIIHTPDENFTDFTKGLIELNTYCQQENVEVNHVVAVGQSSGRLDQILGNIQTLFLAEKKHLLSANTKVYLMSDNAISWLLLPGDHVITVPKNTLKNERAWCSLVPIGETCQNVTTKGLKWNLDNQSLKFGELTRNIYDDEEQEAFMAWCFLVILVVLYLAPCYLLPPLIL